MLWPYKAKTSRTQPKASQWIFSPAVWLRSLIKPDPPFATLFGLLAVELSLQMMSDTLYRWKIVLAALFFVAGAVFVLRSFYGMRIKSGEDSAGGTHSAGGSAGRREPVGAA